MNIPNLSCLVESSEIQSSNLDAQRVAQPISTPPFRRVSRHSRPCRIAVHVEGKIIFVDVASVFAIEARGNEIAVLERSGVYTLRESIGKLYPKLRGHGFVQIHRRVLVNSAFVREIRRQSSGDCWLRLEDGKEYIVGHAYKKKLDSMVESWALQVGTYGAAI